MPLPSQTDYQTALQHPPIAFTDAELQRCRVELNPWGIPRPRSGGFALTFHLMGGAQDYAVRCFHRDVPEIRAKYDSISRGLRADGTGLFETFEYQPHGVKVAGAPHPIIKMAWVKGETLGAWVDSHSRDKTALRALAENVRRAVEALAKVGVAHGDLQHGNIIIVPGPCVRLIDYDGLFVPGMALGNGHEIGHVNYQHPQRGPQHFGPNMDRFSALVIVAALELVAADPSLWDEFNTSDNLLFTRSDFASPATSKLFARAASLPGAGDLSNRLRAVALSPIDQVPALEDFLAGRGIPVVSIPALSAASAGPGPAGATAPAAKPGPDGLYGGQYDIVAAKDRQTLLRREGDLIEVVGTVDDASIRKDRNGNFIGFLNFGDPWKGGFTVVVFPNVLTRLQGRLNFEKLKGKRVSVLGLVERFQRTNNAVSPQIVLEDAARIQLLAKPPKAPPAQGAPNLSSNDDVLRALAGGTPLAKPKPSPAASATKPTPPTPAKRNDAVLRALGGAGGAPTPTPSPPASRPHAVWRPAPPASSAPSAAGGKPTQNTPVPAPKQDDSLLWMGAVVGGVVGTAILPCVGTAAGAWAGWKAGQWIRDSWT